MENSRIKIESVLFDLDGVLVDACEWHYEALNSALREYGYENIDRKLHLSVYNGLPTRVKLQMLGVPEHIALKINIKKQEYTLDIIKNTAKILKEKIELHEYLKSMDIKIACVTNSIKETAKEMLIATGQMPYIDILVSNEMVSKNKPYPECYNYAIKLLGVDPTKSICVEDSPKGIEAALASLAGHLWAVSDTTEVNKENYIKFIDREKICKF